MIRIESPMKAIVLLLALSTLALLIVAVASPANVVGFAIGLGVGLLLSVLVPYPRARE